MEEALDFALRYGYGVLFAFVLAEQVGVPLPALPILLAAGALAGEGRLSFPGAVLVAVAASLMSDLGWYEVGRRRGRSILHLLCRISLEPDSCVRRTEETFARHGARALLYAKFVPGLNTAAPPLAGLFQMRLIRFLVWDALGSLLWAGGLLGLGFVFRAQIETLAQALARLGGWAVVLAVGLAVAFLAWKSWQRRRFLRTLRVGRITPLDLHDRMAAGEELVVVDLRHSLDFEADPVTLPGSLRLTPEEIEERHGEIPRDREVVLYCT